MRHLHEAEGTRPPRLFERIWAVGERRPDGHGLTVLQGYTDLWLSLGDVMPGTCLRDPRTLLQALSEVARDVASSLVLDRHRVLRVERASLSLERVFRIARDLPA